MTSPAPWSGRSERADPPAPLPSVEQLVEICAPAWTAPRSSALRNGDGPELWVALELTRHAQGRQALAHAVERARLLASVLQGLRARYGAPGPVLSQAQRAEQLRKVRDIRASTRASCGAGSDPRDIRGPGGAT